MKAQINYILYLFVALIAFSSCTTENEDPTPGDGDGNAPPVSINFRENVGSVAENNSVGYRVFVDFENLAPAEGAFTVKVEGLNNLVYGQDFKTEPSAQGNSISFTVPRDSSYVSFYLIPVDNNDLGENRKLRLTIQNISGGLTSGTKLTSEITIVDDEDKELFAFTGFEEPNTTIDTLYYDTFSPITDHDLINNKHQPTVNYTSIGEELGFKARYVNTRDSLGLTDGDYVGVTKAKILVNEFAEGQHGYEMSDTDGRMVLTLDEVDISSYLSVNVEMDIWVYDRLGDGDEYESNDYLDIYLMVDNERIEILKTNKERGDSIDDYPNFFNKWNKIVGIVDGNHSKAQLVIEMESNSRNEIIYFDNIRFIGVK